VDYIDAEEQFVEVETAELDEVADAMAVDVATEAALLDELDEYAMPEPPGLWS